MDEEECGGCDDDSNNDSDNIGCDFGSDSGCDDGSNNCSDDSGCDFDSDSGSDDDSIDVGVSLSGLA